MGKKTWTVESESVLMKLKKNGISDGEVASILNCTAHAVRDKYIKLQDARDRKRNGQPWLLEEMMELRFGMENTEFLDRWQRGQWETNQKRFDLNNPKGRMYNMYRDVDLSNYPLSGLMINQLLTTGKIEVKVESKVSNIELDHSSVILNAIYDVKAEKKVSKKSLRNMVTQINRIAKDIPEDKSANVSTYQNNLIKIYVGEVPTTNGITIHGTPQEEKAMVDAAFNFLSTFSK